MQAPKNNKLSRSSLTTTWTKRSYIISEMGEGPPRVGILRRKNILYYQLETEHDISRFRHESETLTEFPTTEFLDQIWSVHLMAQHIKVDLTVFCHLHIFGRQKINILSSSIFQTA